MKNIWNQIIDVTNSTVKKATPIIQNTMQTLTDSANAYVQNVNRKLDDSCFECIYTCEIDQYTKETFFSIHNANNLLYYIKKQNRIFSPSTYHLFTQDDFEIASLCMKRNAQRHAQAENNPIDFYIHMGNEEIEPIRSFKKDALTRTYQFANWYIERPVMTSDFFIYDVNNHCIAQIEFLKVNGNYSVKIMHKNQEVLVLIILMAIQAEYTK